MSENDVRYLVIYNIVDADGYKGVEIGDDESVREWDDAGVGPYVGESSAFQDDGDPEVVGEASAEFRRGRWLLQV
ncbi:hypothetical protein Ae406Ps2_6284c [Pseudonocardia sp. Ae406_Ps2]|nr:hypothetical protein Ae406Ps2_6284c [Pseudonocardia sp. Ae406_Ps2]